MAETATLREVVEKLSGTNQGITDLTNLIKGELKAGKAAANRGKLKAEESSREGLFASLAGAPGRTMAGAGSMVEGAGKGIGGILGGLGGLGSGLGIGAGVAMGGAGALAAGIGYLLDKINSFDGKKIRANVNELLAIKDDFGGAGSFFAEGGLFGATMLMIGTGLAAFSVGAGAAAAVTKFETPGWPEQIKANVDTLLTIGDNPAFGILAGIDFAGTMLGLGVGLAAFAVGQGVGAVAEGVTAAVEMFSGKDFATSIKDQVETLLEIPSLPNATLGSVAGFVGVMGGLALGLTAFAVGKGGATIVEGVSEAITFFTGTPFAQGIVDEVTTLLTIPSLSGVGGDTVAFVAIMGGIAAGLAAFVFGKGVNLAVDGADKAVAYFTEDDTFADKIKKQVETLISIAQIPAVDTVKFIAMMGGISAGIIAFAGGDLVGTLTNATAGIIGFFLNADSPFEHIMKIADNADALTKGADALDKISKAMMSFSGLELDLARFDITGLAEDLAKALPVMLALAQGGKVPGSGWVFDDELPEGGIFSPLYRLNDLGAQINKVRSALSGNFKDDSAAIGGGSGSGSVYNVTNNYYTTDASTNSTNVSGGKNGSGGTNTAPPSRNDVTFWTSK